MKGTWKKTRIVVHILPAYKLNPVMVAASSLSGMKSGSQCMRLIVGENRTCLRLFVGPTPTSGLRCRFSRIGFTLGKWPSTGYDWRDFRQDSMPPNNALTLISILAMK